MSIISRFAKRPTHMNFWHIRLNRLLIVAVLLLGCVGGWSTVFLPKAENAHANMPIKHIVFILKENRSFDTFFGLFPGVKGTSTGEVNVKRKVTTIPLGPFQDKTTYDYDHFWNNAHTAYDNGAMDRFNQGN